MPAFFYSMVMNKFVHKNSEIKKLLQDVLEINNCYARGAEINNVVKILSVKSAFDE